MLVIVIELIDEYFLKTYILYIGMKLRFSFFVGEFCESLTFRVFLEASIFLSCFSKNTLRVFTFANLTGIRENLYQRKLGPLQ